MATETKFSYRVDYRPYGGPYQRGQTHHSFSSAKSERDEKLKLGWNGEFRIMAIETQITIIETEVKG